MELYKNINNEALDEDLKAKREVIERLKKSLVGINEQVVEKIELTKENKTALIKSVLSLNASIDDIFLKSADPRIKEKYNLGDIPYKYNLMATFINKNLSYKNLDEVDKSFVNVNVDKLLPKLQSLNQLAQEYQFLDAFLVPRIIENIQSRQFNTLIDLPEIQSKITEFTELEIKPRKAPAKPAKPQTPAKSGRPRKYATPEASYQAKLQSTARSKQRAKERDKEASKVKTPAQAEVEATEPTEGNIQEDLDEEDEEDEEDEGRIYKPEEQLEIANKKQVRARIKEYKEDLKEVRRQFKNKEISKSEFNEVKKIIGEYIALNEGLLA